MRLIPVGRGVGTGLQVVAAAYPVLTLGVGLAVSVHRTLIIRDPGLGR